MAALIGIPQSPTYNNPIDHEDNCLARRNLVLDRMLTNGYITQEEHDAAQAEGIVLNTTETTVDGLEKYPYFSSYVRDLLVDPDGDYRYSDDELFKGGLTIQTTLDVDSQEAAEAAIKEKRESLDPAINGALVAIEPETGFIKAMVGGDDWENNKLNLATGERGVPNPGRPSGSSFKVFTLIAALEAGHQSDDGGTARRRPLFPIPSTAPPSLRWRTSTTTTTAPVPFSARSPCRPTRASFALRWPWASTR